MALCKRCERWLVAEGDVYCGWCGSELVGYEVALTRDVLFRGRMPLHVQLTVRNLGQTPLEVHNIRADQPWVELPQFTAQTLQPDDPPLSLQVTVADYILPPTGMHEATIQIIAGDGRAPQSVRLQVVPEPHLQIDMVDVEIVQQFPESDKTQ